MRCLALALAVLVSTAARADGAFPSGMSVLLPAGAPQRIFLGTTSGWSSPTTQGARGSSLRAVPDGSGASVLIYQAASNGAVVAAHNDALSSSSDLCTWTARPESISGLAW